MYWRSCWQERLGERLYPLTSKIRPNRVCCFGGVYRIIDFTLSNCINSDVRKILILTQFKSLELHRHIRNGWNILSQELNEYIEIIPPMKRSSGSDWYMGTADAVFQNVASIESEQPDQILILSATATSGSMLQDELPSHGRPDTSRSTPDVTIATTQSLRRMRLRDLGWSRSTRISVFTVSRRSPRAARCGPRSIRRW